MSLAYIIHLANYSDGILYVLMAFLLIVLTVMIDRFWSLRITIIRGQSVIHHTSGYEKLDKDTLISLFKEAGSLPEAEMVDTAIKFSYLERPEIKDRLEETILLLAPRLDRRLWLLDTIVTLAPLMGLFGTIIGMFHAFNVLSSPGHAPTEVTGGVADALAATAFGIFIAMIGLAGYNALSNQVRLIVHQLESLKSMLVNRMEDNTRHTANNSIA